MVYYDTIHQDISDRSYGDEAFRARYGYKEAETHNPPFRRSRDFKPMSYGHFRGMLNFRHSEPYMLLKNMKDIVYEEHHHPIKWTKQALRGGIIGGFLGFCYTLAGDQGAFELNKLIASGGMRDYSGRALR